MKNPLKKYFKGATVKLPFLDMQFGPEAQDAVQRPEVKRTEPPKEAAAIEPSLDPALLNEPDPDAAELEHPISLKGSAFERALLADPEVAARLKHARDTHVAHRALDYFLNGVATHDEKDKESKTWKQIRAACQRLIIETLDHHHQRATYGAVAGIVGLLARSVMSKKPKNHKNSWVVAERDHLPTGYSEAEKHPQLKERSLVLVTPDYLREWLARPT